MNKNYYSKWIFMICFVVGLGSCGPEMPKLTNSSFETMTVKKSDIELQCQDERSERRNSDTTGQRTVDEDLRD